MILTADFAKVIGEPYQRFVMRRPSPVTIQIHYRLTRSRPFESQGMAKKLGINKETLPRPQVTIQDVDVKKLTWEKIKKAAGTHKGYMYGNYYARATMKLDEVLTSASWQLTAYADSEKEAKKRLKELAKLSRSVIGTVTTGHENNDEGRRKEDPQFRKPTVKVYPVWCFVYNYENVKAAMTAKDSGGKPVDYEKKKGRSTATGKQYRAADRIYLNNKEPRKEDIDRLKAVIKSPKKSAEEGS